MRFAARFRLLLAAAAAVSCAAQPQVQKPGSLPQLEDSAKKANGDWLRLAQDLEVRVARVLPCDRSATAAIEEVTRASAARFAALGEYMSAAIEQASQQTAAAKAVQGRQGIASNGLSAERTDTQRERTAVESQVNDLADSVKKKPVLAKAEEQLKSLYNLSGERAANVSRIASADQAAAAGVAQFVQTLEQREQALKQMLPVIEEERARWNGYYNARLARARIECSVTGGR